MSESRWSSTNGLPWQDGHPHRSEVAVFSFRRRSLRPSKPRGLRTLTPRYRINTEYA